MSTLALSAAEIEDIRSTLEAQMFQTAVISRITLTSDAMGGSNEAGTPVGTAICRVSAAGQRSGLSLMGQVIAGRIDNRDQYLIPFPHDTDVRNDDSIAVEGRTFRALAILHSDWEFSKRAMVTPA